MLFGLLKFEEDDFVHLLMINLMTTDIISDQTDQDLPQWDANERRMVLGGCEHHVADVRRSLFFLRPSMAEQVQ